MLTDQGFIQYCKNREYSKKAQAEMKYIRSAEPSRRVKSARGNVSGSYPCRTMGVTIQFESHRGGELPFIHKTDHDKEVLEIYDQPPPIPLSYILQKGKREGKRTAYRYTPDFFLIKKDAAGWVECKMEEELHQKAEEHPEQYVRTEEGHWRCPPGEEYAKQFGFFFQVVSSASLNPIFSRNIEYLRDYLKDGQCEADQDAAEQVLRLVAEEPGISIEELKQRADRASSDDINILIAKEQVYFNLDTAPLADPKHARLYPDEDTAVAYSITCDTVFCPPNSNTGVVRIFPETTILWDNKPWTIVNPGETKVTLVSEDGRQSIAELLYEQIYNLINRGSLVGLKDEVQATIDVTKARELFAGARREDFQIANHRYDTIRSILERKGLTSGCSETERTLWNWVSKYHEATRLYGNGYIGLLPQIKDRGNRTPRIRQDTLRLIDKFIKNEYQKLKQENKATVYGKFLEKCEADHVPGVSYKTFIREISKCSGYEQTKKRKGRKGAYNEKLWFWELEWFTPRHGDRPWEIVHIDHTQLDIELIHSKTKKNLGRPWLTILIDAYSRRILAIFLTFDKPSYRSCMMVLRECVRRHHRLPQTIVYDGGKEFSSTYFETLLARYECTRKVRPWSEPRYGTTCERIFGTIHTKFVHNLLGNTQLMKNVRLVTKDVNPKELAVWDLENFYKLLCEFCYEFYDSQQEHPALGQTPREAYGVGLAMHGRRANTYIAYDEDFIMYTFPTTRSGKAKVQSTSGVQMHNIRYWAKAFDNPEVKNTVVPVRYDPFDASTAYAYVKGKWVRCVSDFAADFKGRSEKEIEIASHELRQRNKRHGQQFNINQKQLASLLRTADATEVLQMQRLHDSEVKSVLATIHGERVDKEEIDLSLPPTQSSAETHPVSVLDADIELQKRPRKLKTFEDY